jgi:hypothetical protein
LAFHKLSDDSFCSYHEKISGWPEKPCFARFWRNG